MGAQHNVLLFHTEAHWLSRGKVLESLNSLKNCHLFVQCKLKCSFSHISPISSENWMNWAWIHRKKQDNTADKQSNQCIQQEGQSINERLYHISFWLVSENSTGQCFQTNNDRSPTPGRAVWDILPTLGHVKIWLGTQPVSLRECISRSAVKHKQKSWLFVDRMLHRTHI